MSNRLFPRLAPVPVAVAGASGLVGSRLLDLLAGHPVFRVVARLGPPGRGLDPLAAAGEARLVFSALPAAVAKQWEPRWLEEGRWVVTTGPAGAGESPVVPELNAAVLPPPAGPPQRVAVPNCAAHGLALALGPLRPLGLDRAVVTTLQALSGAGRRGVPALASGDDLLPFIPGEEERLAGDAVAVLGPGLRLSVQCNRVPVEHGHTLSVAAGFARPVGREEILASWTGLPARPLPSAPRPPLRYREEPDRPRPRLDREALAGMQVVLGRLEPCPVLGWRFVVLVHNLIRGAAGALLLAAEELLLNPDRIGGP